MAFHVFVELYDRGNIVLTDHEFKILNILRPRVQGEEKFLVRETYPVEGQPPREVDREKVIQVLASAKAGDTLKKVT